MRGYIHLYTGNGKGKTTAALGLAMRASGAGKSIFIAQFVKGKPYSEHEAIKHLPEITIMQFGLDCFIINNPTEKDIKAAQTGFNYVKKISEENKHDIIILDEITIALHYKLIDINDVLQFLKNKYSQTEIILTGRFAPDKLIDAADLVTEMKEIKHYYNNGVEARKGIES